MTDRELMIRAAWMYYHDNLTHAEIARRLHLSRVKVTRLLKRAREQGIVEIRVTQPMPPDLELSRQMEHRFGLEQAIVVSSTAPDALGQATAELLLYLMKGGLYIGFGWSSTVSRIASYIATQDKNSDCTIVDLIGTMVGEANPYSVSGSVADALKARLMPLAVPVMVSSRDARDTLLAEPSIAATLDAARRCDVAFVGVGEIGPTNTMVEIGQMEADKLHELEAHGAVGEMLIRYYDINGKAVINDTHERIIGLTLHELEQIPSVVLVAHGQHKVKALIGALNSGIASILITDIETATLLLAEPNTDLATQ